jgi:DNA (cytosine-5)-methyltransferase 1
MKVGSLFSGAGGGDLGLIEAGHEIVFACEKNSYVRSVLRFHNPLVKIYNDVQEVTAERLKEDGIEFPDIIFGGSPCQNLSMVGDREGLDGHHSALFREQCRIADELSTEWLLWENVANALRSSKGEDFAQVLKDITGFHPQRPDEGWRNAGICIGYKRTAVWRVLNSQYFGVPQHRRRIFLVANTGRPRSNTIKILLEQESI